MHLRSLLIFACCAGISAAAHAENAAQNSAENAPAGSARDAWGPLYSPLTLAAPDADIAAKRFVAISSLRLWNQIAIDASGLDHKAPAPGENRVFGEQLGPARASRAMAIVHIAMFDAVNAIVPRYRSYNRIPWAFPGTSIDAAVAQAAHKTLTALFPSQKPRFDQALRDSLSGIRAGWQKQRGIEVGERAATAILARRANDGAEHKEMRVGVDFINQTGAGFWRQDPISQIPLAMGARWDEVKPFVIRSATQFRLPPPPALDSPEYAAAFNEVKALGGDGITTPTMRTKEQTEIGIYWAYDGTPSLCAPPRLYNQVALHIADQMRTGDVELARLLALVNTAMADAGVASWESKFYYETWRPITGIREADAGTGASGTGDGNPATIGDATFRPFGAPASNLMGPNFTPPFPAYPSGHATFGGALFQTLRLFYRRDNIAFTFVSDEYDGKTLDNSGRVRALHPRSFTSLSQAEEENGQSRIYLGIHWAFDKTAGIDQGRKIASYVYRNAFQPL